MIVFRRRVTSVAGSRRDVRCFLVCCVMVLSRASSNSMAIVLVAMTSSRCSKNMSLYFCLNLAVRTESLLLDTFGNEWGRYFFGIVRCFRTSRWNVTSLWRCLARVVCLWYSLA